MSILSKTFYYIVLSRGQSSVFYHLVYIDACLWPGQRVYGIKNYVSHVINLTRGNLLIS